MKLCIPTDSGAGLQARIHAHFGTAPFFTIADTEDGSVTVIPNRHQSHRHGHCLPLEQLAGRDVDEICCSGMGRGAYERLQAQGIGVRIIDRGLVREIMDLAKDHRLRPMDTDNLCGGQHHRHRHRHGHGAHRCHDYGRMRRRARDGGRSI